jgi:hypothetical protein
MSILDQKERNLLPDSDYAAVYTTVSRRNGRTARTKVRKFPINDPAHVRNALARFTTAKLPSHIKEVAHKRIVAAAKKYGIGID